MILKNSVRMFDRYIKEKIDSKVLGVLESNLPTAVVQVQDDALSKLKSAANITELSEYNSESIRLDLASQLTDSGEEACVITCVLCNDYLKKGNPDEKVRKALGFSFAAGHLIDSKNFKLFKKGSECSLETDRKLWFSFRCNACEHHLTLIRKKAVDFSSEVLSREKRSMKVTKNIISIAIACVKSNSAAMHFTPLLSTIHEAGCDIGNIGHSR